MHTRRLLGYGLSLAAIAAGAVGLHQLGVPGFAVGALVACAVLLVGLVALVMSGRSAMTQRLLSEVGVADVGSLRVASRTAPRYRFVDLFRATASWCDEQGATKTLDLEDPRPLEVLLSDANPPFAESGERHAASLPYSVGPDEEDFLPTSRLWFRRAGAGATGLVVRARLNLQAYPPSVAVEAASADLELAQRAVREIDELARRESVYRGRRLHVSVADSISEELGQLGATRSFTVEFSETPSVSEDAIVLDEDVRRIIVRNVVDVQRRRDQLREQRVPRKRGVLFYGPPGTGKTYAARYAIGLLENVTVITASGTSVLQAREIFDLARMLQPALVVLEDVDLVFQTRDTNFHAPVLGDLMDELDGMKPDDDVSVLLTTNAIDRVEAAVKDRPGRISQCVRFEAPSQELRRRYLELYLRDRPTDALDVAKLVSLSDRSTQAFLKEWVYRSVHFALERAGPGAALRTEDFEQAMTEMRTFAERAQHIVGFGAGSR